MKKIIGTRKISYDKGMNTYLTFENGEEWWLSSMVVKGITEYQVSKKMEVTLCGGVKIKDFVVVYGRAFGYQIIVRAIKNGEYDKRATGLQTYNQKHSCEYCKQKCQ